MLEHGNSEATAPNRVVLLGASGFVGKSLAQSLNDAGIDTVALSSSDLDLCSNDATGKLSELLKPEDSLVILSALTPDKGRGVGTFTRNIKMMENICNVLSEVECAHVVYFSSDAVYPLGDSPVNEESAAAAPDLYGIMHRSRELMLLDSAKSPVCILRSTLIFGAGDTHNSYGPNRFRRVAAADGKIGIGGEGEETRDHIYIDDVVALATLVLSHKSTGILNVATGRSIDFGALARLVAAQFDSDVEVCPSPRGMPISHRSFDVTAIHKAFPGFTFTPLEVGIELAHKGES